MQSRLYLQDNPQFTVNTAVDQVQLNAYSGGYYGTYATNNTFQAGDNFILRAVGIRLPYSFGPGDNNAGAGDTVGLRLEVEDILGANGWLPNFDGGFQRILVPLFCHELPINQFVDLRQITGGGAFDYTQNFRIMTTNIDMNISMVNAPAALNGDTLDVVVYLDVEHTVPMS